MLGTARAAHPSQFVAGGCYTSGRSISLIAREDRIAGCCKSTSGSTAPLHASPTPEARDLRLSRFGCVRPASDPGNERTCRMRRTGRRIRRQARYLALPVVPDGMIMSATCLSLGLISRTSLFASLVYSYSLATETCLVALLGNWRIDSD
jgi:hypothetical protein